MILYKITFPNDRVYIGITTRSLKRRVDQHRQQMYKQNNKVQKAFRKYGFENCKFEILERHINLFFLIESEIFNIWAHNSKRNGYNSTFGGDGTFGRPITKAEREKSSIASKKRWSDPAFREKMKKVQKGHPKLAIQDQYGTVYESGADAARILGIKASNICHVIKGNQKSAGGYVFKKVKEDK